MSITLTNVFVDDQEKAVAIYTEVVGFVEKLDSPVGQYKWLTVVSPEEPKVSRYGEVPMRASEAESKILEGSSK